MYQEIGRLARGKHGALWNAAAFIVLRRDGFYQLAVERLIDVLQAEQEDIILQGADASASQLAASASKVALLRSELADAFASFCFQLTWLCRSIWLHRHFEPPASVHEPARCRNCDNCRAALSVNGELVLWARFDIDALGHISDVLGQVERAQGNGVESFAGTERRALEKSFGRADAPGHASGNGGAIVDALVASGVLGYRLCGQKWQPVVRSSAEEKVDYSRITLTKPPSAGKAASQIRLVKADCLLVFFVKRPLAEGEVVSIRVAKRNVLMAQWVNAQAVPQN